METKSPTQITGEQQETCKRYGAECAIPNRASKFGISAEALRGKLPIHGLRHRPSGGTCGWYIWSDKYSADPDFFLPMHVAHAIDQFAPYVSYLGLPPGWRFLIGNDGYEDVWFDETLLAD